MAAGRYGGAIRSLRSLDANRGALQPPFSHFFPLFTSNTCLQVMSTKTPPNRGGEGRGGGGSFFLLRQADGLFGVADEIQ